MSQDETMRLVAELLDKRPAQGRQKSLKATIARRAMIAEQERRSKWREVAERAAKISPVTE